MVQLDSPEVVQPCAPWDRILYERSSGIVATTAIPSHQVLKHHRAHRGKQWLTLHSSGSAYDTKSATGCHQHQQTYSYIPCEYIIRLMSAERMDRVWR